MRHGTRLICAAGQKGYYCSSDRGLSWRYMPYRVAATGPGVVGRLALTSGGTFLLSGAGDDRIYRLFQVANRDVVFKEVYFARASARPSARMIPFLKDIARYLNSHPGQRVRIEGHTDSDGSDDFNMKLSRERAAAVKEILVKCGAPANRIDTVGYGEDRPLFSNTSARNKQRNRRVEILIIQDLPKNLRL